MLKFAHIADVHLGYEQYRLPYRAIEFRDAFRAAVSKAIEERVDFILVSGDLFHQSRPSPETLKDAMDILKLARDANVPVFAIEGNHDRTQRRISAYHLLESLGYLNLLGIREERVEGKWTTSERLGEGKWLVKGTFEKNGEGVEIHGIKYMSAAWLERNRLKGIFKPEGDSILMLHQGIREIMERMSLMPETQRDYYELSLEDLPKGYLYYALGHIHRNYATSYGDGTLVYPGSLQRWDFGDYERRYVYDRSMDTFKEKRGTEKGFYVVEDFKPRFVRIDVRPFIDVELKADGETAKRVLRKLADEVPREAFVRLTLSWKRPYDVSTFQELLNVRYLHLRTRFGGASDKGGKKNVVRPEDYFLPVENEIIKRVSTHEVGEREIDDVISLLMGEGWEGEGEKKREEKKISEVEGKKREEKRSKPGKTAKTPRGKPTDITSWLRGWS